jgi:hypothetical protein
MGALFPPWANTAIRVAIGGIVIAGLAVIAAPMIYVRTPLRRGQLDPRQQPVEFDHRHHVRDDGIDCLYCHSEAARSRWAGVPPTELCMGCHSQIWKDSPLLLPVRQSYVTGLPIPWIRIHNVPDFAYFNHAIHTNKGFGCVTCHGRVDQMARVYQVASLSMGWCLDCHRAPEKYIRPLHAITDMEWQPASDAEGQELAAKLNVRQLTHCTTCHR